MKINDILNRAFQCVKTLCVLHNIDESHAMHHSLTVMRTANLLFDEMKNECSGLVQYKMIILVSAIIHDMCDKKYVNETIGLKDIRDFLSSAYISDSDFNIIERIITHMSYSYVKENGFYDFNDVALNTAYNIVRESDILASYDFDRCLVYGMLKSGLSHNEAINVAKKLFDVRVLKYLDDGMLTTERTKQIAIVKHNDALIALESTMELLNNEFILPDFL